MSPAFLKSATLFSKKFYLAWLQLAQGCLTKALAGSLQDALGLQKLNLEQQYYDPIFNLSNKFAKQGLFVAAKNFFLSTLCVILTNIASVILHCLFALV